MPSSFAGPSQQRHGLWRARNSRPRPVPPREQRTRLLYIAADRPRWPLSRRFSARAGTAVLVMLARDVAKAIRANVVVASLRSSSAGLWPGCPYPVPAEPEPCGRTRPRPQTPQARRQKLCRRWPDHRARCPLGFALLFPAGPTRVAWRIRDQGLGRPLYYGFRQAAVAGLGVAQLLAGLLHS